MWVTAFNCYKKNNLSLSVVDSARIIISYPEMLKLIASLFYDKVTYGVGKYTPVTEPSI
jgi:uncharacterized membrane protein